MGTCSTNGNHSTGLVFTGRPATVHRGCYVLRRVVSTSGLAGNIALRKVISQASLAANYSLCFALCGLSERAIKTKPPTSRISITMVLKRLVG